MLQLLALASSTIRIGFTLLLRISACSKRKHSLKFWFKYLPLTWQSLWIPSEYYQEHWSALENNSFPISKFSLIAPLAWTRCCCISCLHFPIKREDTLIKGIIMKSADKNKICNFFSCLQFLVQLSDQQVVALTIYWIMCVTCCSIQHYYILVLISVESVNNGS